MTRARSATRGVRTIAVGGLGIVGCLAGVVAPALVDRVTVSAAPIDVTTLTDDTGLLKIDVPIGWTDVTTAPLVYDDGSNIAQIVAAPDQTAFYDTYTTPGMIYSGADYDEDSETAVANQYDFTGICTDAGVTSYADSYFRGSMQTWTDCDGTASQIVTVFASPLDRSFSISLLVQIPTSTDAPALDVVVDSFYVVSPTTTQLRDDSDTLVVSVPNAWAETATDAGQNSSGATSPAITATSDFDRLGDVPGLRFYTELYTSEPNTLLGFGVIAGCNATDVVPYDDGYFEGFRQDYTECPNGTRVTMVAANGYTHSVYTVVVQIVTDPGDDISVDIVLATFNYTEAPGGS